MPQALEPQCVFSGVERVFAVGDLHGNHAGLLRILRETGLVDGRARWLARHTHLVLLGDVLGRGGEPGKIFALVRRLEAEAQALGSRVHLLLGNHEAMTLAGILRYNTLEEFRDLEAAFPGADGPRDGVSGGPGREAARDGLDAKLGRRLDMLGAREFRQALAPGGAVGAWLLSHASAVAINEHLFVHGGLNRAHGRMPLETLNARVRAGLAAGTPPGEAPGGADSGGNAPGREIRARATADKGAREADDIGGVRRDGPQWHRDYALDSGPDRRDELEEVLEYHGCRRMVVGHTPTSCIDPAMRGRIVPLHEGKLYCVDTGIGRAYGAHLSALNLCGRAPQPLYFR